MSTGVARNVTTWTRERRLVPDLVRSLVAMLAAAWPMLLAIELASRIAGTVLIGLAGFVGAASAVGGFAITAIAAIVTLTATVLQLLVLLRSLRSEPAGAPMGWRRSVQGLAASILPAFVLLSAWGQFQDEVADYALGALEHTAFGSTVQPGTVLDVPVDVFTISLLVGCVIVRAVLRRLEERELRGVAVVSLVAEGLWVFLAVQVLTRVLDAGIGWLEGTRLASWWDAAGAALHGVIGDLPAEAFDRAGDAWHTITVPIMWVTLAFITLLGSRTELAEAQEPTRFGRWFRGTLDRLPSPLDDVAEELTDDLQDRWVPVSQAVRRIAGAGVVSIALIVLVWYVVQVAMGWLTVGLMHVAGPEPRSFAVVVASVGEVVGDVLASIVSIAVAVAALDALRLAAMRGERR